MRLAFYGASRKNTRRGFVEIEKNARDVSARLDPMSTLSGTLFHRAGKRRDSNLPQKISGKPWSKNFSSSNTGPQGIRKRQSRFELAPWKSAARKHLEHFGRSRRIHGTGSFYIHHSKAPTVGRESPRVDCAAGGAKHSSILYLPRSFAAQFNAWRRFSRLRGAFYNAHRKNGKSPAVDSPSST